jgi:hypothetical protein
MEDRQPTGIRGTIPGGRSVVLFETNEYRSGQSKLKS